MKHTRTKEWFDNEAFWRDLYPFMFPETRFAEADEQLDQLLALIEPKGNTALDLCCGPGRFSVALAKKGFAVTAVDRTSFLLGKARARAKAARVNIELMHGDMRDFVRPAVFDVVLSPSHDLFGP